MVSRGFRISAVCAAALLGLIGCTSRDLEKGEACLALGDYPMAIRFFSRVAEKDPLDFAARVGLGKALIQKSAAEGDSAAIAYALVQLEAGRSLNPDADLAPLIAEAYLEKARSCLQRLDTTGALASLARSVERDPKGVSALNLAGIIYAKLGDPDRATALFGKALTLDSTSASAHFNQGMLDWQAGEVQKAHGHWLEALKALPEDEDALYWLALAEKRLRGAP